MNREGLYKIREGVLSMRMNLVALPDDDDRLTFEQAAAMLRRSAMTVRTYVAEGRLSARKILGRVFLSRREVEEFSELPELPPAVTPRASSQPGTPTKIITQVTKPIRKPPPRGRR